MIVFLLIACSLIAAAASAFVRRNTSLLEIIAAVAGSAELIGVLWIARAVVENGHYAVSPLFLVDALGAVVLLTVAIVGCATSFYSIGYLRQEVAKGIIGFHRVRQYYILFHLFLMAMFFAITTVNPIMMWIAVEATTLSTAFLISFYNNPSATEAAWKYLIINSIGLLLGFFGTLLFLSAAIEVHGTGFVDWHTLIARADMLNPLIAKMAFIFVLIGYGTKVGLAPMHTWRPDAYSKAPTPIVALFSGSLLNVAFLAIVRFKEIADIALGVSFSQGLLLFFGLLSIVISAFIILIQKNYKRLFAYSSIEHAGIIALGFGFGGIGAFAAILHMFYHALAKSIMFFSAGNLFVTYNTAQIAQIRGVLSILPITGILLFIGFLALLGIPPSGTFITEFYILSAGMSTHPFVTGIALLSFVIIFVGFLRHLSHMIFGEVPQDIVKSNTNHWMLIPPIVLVFVLMGTSIFFPASLKILIDAAAAVNQLSSL